MELSIYIVNRLGNKNTGCSEKVEDRGGWGEGGGE